MPSHQHHSLPCRCTHHAARHAAAALLPLPPPHSSRRVCIAAAGAGGSGGSNSSTPPPPVLDDSGWGELGADTRSSRSNARTSRSSTNTSSAPASTTRVRRLGQGSSGSGSRGAGAGQGSDSSWRDAKGGSSSRWFTPDDDVDAGASPSRQQGRWQQQQPAGRDRDSRDSSRAPPGASAAALADHPDALPGDWVCSECQELNFARRQECRTCFAPAPPRAPRSTRDSSSSSARADAFESRPGDWQCSGCGDLNFSWRTECRSCQEPRPAGASPSSSSSRYGSSSRDGKAGSKPAKKLKKASSLVDKGVACCYGCGAPLQSQVPAAAGYVAADRFEAKKKHRQLQQVLCGRCQDLAHGAMIPAVKDFTQKAWLDQQEQLIRASRTQTQQVQQTQDKQQQDKQQPQVFAGGAEPLPPSPSASASAAGVDAAAAAAAREPLELLGKVLVTAEELRDKIAEVSSVKALVVMLVDLLDVSGTLMGKVRDMVGNNPIVLVGTKLDLLPPGCSNKELAAWLTEAAARRRLQVTSTHLISSRSGEGVSVLAGKIARERKGRDVFVVGAANVGKSAFVRALLKEMSSLAGGNFDAAAASTSRYLPVESAMPGTTLGIIPLQAFETGGTLYDTPGVHLHHRVPHMLAPEELKLLHPRRRLAPFSPPTPLEVVLEQLQEDEGEEEDGRQWKERLPATAATGSSSSSSRPKPKQVSASYLWAGLVRVDVLAAPPSTALVFYGPQALRVAALPLLAEGQQVELDFEGGDEDEDAEDGGDADSSGSGGDDDDESSSSSSSSQTAGRSSRKKRSRQVLVCTESVAARGGLVPHHLHIPMPQIPTSQCLADVAVSGLPGWVSLYAPFATQPLQLRVWVPRGVEVFLRPPLPCPPPPRASSSANGKEGSDDVAGSSGGADLADIGSMLDATEADGDWQQHRSQLGLKPMSAEDEAVIKMLLYGSEDQGLTGIMDMEDEELDEEEEGEEADTDDDDDSAAAAAAGSSGAAGDDAAVEGDIASLVARALQAETLAATAADAVGRPAPAARPSRQGRAGIRIVEDEEDADAAGVGAGRRRRRR